MRGDGRDGQVLIYQLTGVLDAGPTDPVPESGAGSFVFTDD
jgi:hypothetical protein